MGWTNQAADELIAPNTVPFVPGQNVTGFGSQVPAELVAAGFPNAIVFYATDWVATNTTPTVKFRFIAANANGLTIGYGLVTNPSVSQTAAVVLSETIQSPSDTNGISIKSSDGTELYLLGQIGGNAYMRLKDQAGLIRMDTIVSGIPGSSFVDQEFYDNAGTRRILLSAFDGSTGSTSISLTDSLNVQRIGMSTDEALHNASWSVYDTLGNARLRGITSDTLINMVMGVATFFQTFSTGYVLTNTPIVKDSSYTSLSSILVNGWTADATRPPMVRMMPDDTVAMKGNITKVANPVAGELFLNALSSVYRPLTTRSFLTATPGRAYNGSQVAEVLNNGTARLWDMAAAAGVLCLDQIRYSADNV